jgi:hypothetical protein
MVHIDRNLDTKPFYYLNRLHLHTKHRRQIPNNRILVISTISRGVHLHASRSEISPALIQRVHGHGIAQDIHIAVFLR